MSTILLDTDVVSYLFKQDSRRAYYTPYLLNHELAIAIMTVAELFQWTTMRQWGEARVQRMESWLERFMILPVDIETCRAWGSRACASLCTWFADLPSGCMDRRNGPALSNSASYAQCR